MLEGGYDLDALQHSTVMTLAELMGREFHPEAPTAGGPGHGVLERVRLPVRTGLFHATSSSGPDSI
ncbi:MAG: hypothetical protein R2705_07150 [Ilumatobacteraceae bacterium]